MENEIYLYPSQLSSWVRTFRIYITAWFACYDLLITAQIVPLDCRIAAQRYPLSFITARIDIWALQRLECGDELTAQSDSWVAEIVLSNCKWCRSSGLRKVFVSEPWVAPRRISVLIGKDLVLIAGIPKSCAALIEWCLIGCGLRMRPEAFFLKPRHAWKWAGPLVEKWRL